MRASALNLVVTAIIYWNTVYLGRVVDLLVAKEPASLSIPDGDVTERMGAYWIDRRLHLRAKPTARCGRLPASSARLDLADVGGKQQTGRHIKLHKHSLIFIVTGSV